MITFTDACKIIRELTPGTLEDFLSVHGWQSRYEADIIDSWTGVNIATLSAS